MDRFIGKPILSALQQTICLKSNMDRFIEYRMFIKDNSPESLKSNMDRFIDRTRNAN